MKTKLTLEEEDDLPYWKRKSLCKINDKAENIRRSEFWPDLAKQHGLRLAALVFKVAIKTAHKYTNKGKRGHAAGWNDRAEVWARWIGLTDRKQVYRLLKKAKKAKLLNWRKTGTGELIWVLKTKLYERITFDNGKLVYTSNYYNHRRGLSLPATIILDKIKYYEEHAEWYDNQGVKNTLRGWQEVFPFLSANAIKWAMRVLRSLNLVYQDAEGAWRLNKKAYRKYTAKKRIVSTKKQGVCGGDTKGEEGTMVGVEGTPKGVEGTTKSAQPQQNLSSPSVDPSRSARRVHLASPPHAEAKSPAVISSGVADDAQVRFSSLLEEDTQAQEKMEHGQKVPAKVGGRPADLSSVKSTKVTTMTKTTDMPEQEQVSAMNYPVSLPVKAAKEEEEDPVPTLGELLALQELEKQWKKTVLTPEEEVRRNRTELIKKVAEAKARDRQEQEQKLEQEAKAKAKASASTVPAPESKTDNRKPKRLSSYDRWVQQEGQASVKKQASQKAAISPEVIMSVESRNRMEEEEVRASMGEDLHQP